MNLPEVKKQNEIMNNREIRICVPITGRNLGEFIGNMEKARRLSGLVELRSDFIEGLQPSDVSLIRKKAVQESIFTCRKKTEGGKFGGREQQRIAILNEALGLSFNYVDIELSTLQEDKIDLSRKGKTKLIVSHHDFEGTPNEIVLRKIIGDMKERNPDIIKVATQVINPEDNYKLFRLMLDDSIGLPRILIGMGKLGEITRIIGPILGNYLTFASMNNQVTAQGQIDINQLRRIYKLMGVKS